MTSESNRGPTGFETREIAATEVSFGMSLRVKQAASNAMKGLVF